MRPEFLPSSSRRDAEGTAFPFYPPFTPIPGSDNSSQLTADYAQQRFPLENNSRIPMERRKVKKYSLKQNRDPGEKLNSPTPPSHKRKFEPLGEVEGNKTKQPRCTQPEELAKDLSLLNIQEQAEFRQIDIYYQLGLKAFKKNPPDYSTAFGYFKQAADEGHCESAWYVGSFYAGKLNVEGLPCLENGQQIRENIDLAVKYYELSAIQGDRDALYGLWTLYQDNKWNPADEELPVKYGKKAAYAGHLEAQIELYEKYRDEENFTSAFEFCKLAADHPEGLPWLKYDLYQMYLSGTGVEKNFDEALIYCRLSADEDEEHALYDLGMFCEEGIYVEKSISLAKYYYQKAADESHEEAEGRLEVLKTMKSEFDEFPSCFKQNFNEKH